MHVEKCRKRKSQLKGTKRERNREQLIVNPINEYQMNVASYFQEQTKKLTNTNNITFGA